MLRHTWDFREEAAEALAEAGDDSGYRDPPLRFLTSGHGNLALRASVRINQTPPVKQGPPPYRTVVAMH